MTRHRFLPVCEGWFVWVLAALMLAWLAPAMRAQVLYGSVVGTVQDPTGGVVPNATVTITNRGTSQSQETKRGSGAGDVAHRLQQTCESLCQRTG